MVERLQRLVRTWWGRSLFGAFLGGMLVAFSNVDDPTIFLIGMVLGAAALFFLGRWE